MVVKCRSCDRYRWRDGIHRYVANKYPKARGMVVARARRARGARKEKRVQAVQAAPTKSVGRVLVAS